MADDGTQSNPVRDEATALLGGPSLPRARKLAQRLRDVTTHRSGLGLVFLLTGKAGAKHKLVISRFPADEGILADATSQSLELEFIERIFMKNARTYKAVVYTGTSLVGSFWDGSAIDTQINAKGQDSIARYWIQDFLLSELRTTSKAGTKRFAEALSAAVKAAETPGMKHELVSAIKLSAGLDGQTMSARQLMGRFALSDDARDLVVEEFPNLGTLEDAFVFDATEFARHAAFTTVELHTGALLTAPSSSFDEVFQAEAVNEELEQYRYSTTGRVVDRRIRKRAP